VSLTIEQPEVVTEQVSVQRSTVGREEGLDVSLLLRPTGRGVDERLELESDERFRVDHRDTQPGTAEEPVPGPAQHVQGSLATSEDEVDRRESRRRARIVRGVSAPLQTPCPACAQCSA